MVLQDPSGCEAGRRVRMVASMSLAKKLNFRPGMKALVIGRPVDVELDDLRRREGRLPTAS